MGKNQKIACKNSCEYGKGCYRVIDDNMTVGFKSCTHLNQGSADPEPDDVTNN